MGLQYTRLLRLSLPKWEEFTKLKDAEGEQSGSVSLFFGGFPPRWEVPNAVTFDMEPSEGVPVEEWDRGHPQAAVS